MPNPKTHSVVGAAVGAGLNIAKQMAQKAADSDYQFDFLELIVWSGVGGAVACIADVLGPALHPNHRRICHSLAVAGLILRGLVGDHARNFTADQRDCANLFGYPYLSHLLLDSMTKKGLPLI
jgi:inner membrane protein